MVDVHLANAYTISLATGDRAYRRILEDAVANLPDGRPLEWATRHSQAPLTQVRGPRLFNDVMRLGRDYGVRHFLLGTTNETLLALRYELERRYPGVQVVGSYSPPFRDQTPEEMAAQDALIRESGAHITWVGLGTPRQDFEVHRLARSLPGVVVGVGAAFDFVAGTKQEAPCWITKAGLEWAFRLACEPRRLWKRYLYGNLTFIRAVVARASS